MLFESLDKLKRNSILSAILLLFLGAVIIVCPQAYIPALTLAFGYALVIIAIVLILNFLSGKKSLMEYLKFTGALILGLVGIAALVYRNDIMRVLACVLFTGSLHSRKRRFATQDSRRHAADCGCGNRLCHRAGNLQYWKADEEKVSKKAGLPDRTNRL